jgi:glucan phosphoethanolaminetransferase (alkaline phosphatase superfamily)
MIILDLEKGSFEPQFVSGPVVQRKALIPMVGIPLLMAVIYFAFVFARLNNRFLFIFEHAIVLTLWISTTILLMTILQKPLFLLKTKLISIPLSLVPAMSYLLLYLIYIGSIIGLITWGEIPSMQRVMLFLVNIFQVAQIFQIHISLVVAAILVPFLLFVSFFQWRGFELAAWVRNHQKIYQPYNLLRHRWIALILSFSWIAGFVLMFSADPSIDRIGNFQNDPIVCFFKSKPGRTHMTPERVLWIQRDRLAKMSLKRLKPQVRNIFIICVDACRPDHLPLYGYQRPLMPFFSGIQKSIHARRMDMCLSNAMSTDFGQFCLFTSKEPMSLSRFDYTLPDFLSDHGFNTTIIMTGDHHWLVENKIYGRNINHLVDGSNSPGPGGVCDDELAVNAISNLPPDDGGYHFFFIMLMSTHPLCPLSKRFEHYKPSKNFIQTITDNEPKISRFDQIAINNMYDNRVLQLDSVLKRIFMLFESKGYLKDYIGVLTGDHGQLLGEREKYGHTFYCYLPGIRVPLIFFGSKPLPSFPQTSFAVQMDVAPTLADLAGLNVPESWQGQSLLRKRQNPWTYHMTPSELPKSEGAVVRYSPDKILKYSRRLRMNKNDDLEWLYDIKSDPNEEMNLIHHVDPFLLDQIRHQAKIHLSVY